MKLANSMAKKPEEDEDLMEEDEEVLSEKEEEELKEKLKSYGYI